MRHKECCYGNLKLYAALESLMVMVVNVVPGHVLSMWLCVQYVCKPIIGWLSAASLSVCKCVFVKVETLVKMLLWTWTLVLAALLTGTDTPTVCLATLLTGPYKTVISYICRFHFSKVLCNTFCIPLCKLRSS